MREIGWGEGLVDTSSVEFRLNAGHLPRPVQVIALSLVTGHHAGGSAGAFAKIYAEDIVKDPQRHLDALREAGILPSENGGTQ